MADSLPEKPHESPKKQPRSFFSFWRRAFKKAFKKSWGKYGHALIAFGLLYTVGAFWLSKWAKKELWGLDMSTWVTLVIPGMLFAAFVVYNLLRAPYEIYLEQWKEAESERNTHAKERQELESQIATLRTTLDDSEHRKEIKSKLAVCLTKMECRILEIKSMAPHEYKRISKNEPMDMASVELIKEIASFLKSEIGDSEASLFLSISGFSFSKSDQAGISSDMVSELNFNHRMVISLLQLYANQLKETIKLQIK